MQQRLVIDRVSKFVLLLVPLVTLIVTPSLNFDALNLSKFALLTVGTCLIIGLVSGLSRSSLIPSKIVRFLSVVLLTILILNLIFNGMTARQLFGSYGSNFGFVTITCLLVLFAVMSLEYEVSFYRRFLGALVIAGTFNALYGVVQALDSDPIDWVKPYNEFVGTLGNPNFFSALLGISAVACLALTMGGVPIFLRIALLLLFLLMISLVFLSDSIQGFFAASAGVLILLYSRFVRKSAKHLRFTFLVLTVTCGLFVVWGILNRGPLSSILYGNSIIARNFYWAAALEMVKARPLTGHGFDSFGEKYRAYRSETSLSSFGPDLVANSAHNVPLDFAVYGGLPLLVALVVLMLASFRSGLKIILRTGDFDVAGTGLFGCWIATVVQMLVSPMQIGVSIWFWALSGSLIGYQNATLIAKGNPKPVKLGILPPQVILFGSLASVVGALLVIQPVSKDIHFQRAVQAQDAQQIVVAANRWPQDSYYFNYASELFLASQLYLESLTLSKKSVSINPDNFVGWRLIYLNPEASRFERTIAGAAMRRLDPKFKF